MSTEIRAQNSLALTSVKAIKDATDESQALLESMRQSAEDAGTTLTGIYQDAEDAKASAESAQASADNASEYASRALGNLSTVQSVAETLTWITQHGTMTLTTDTALDPTHVYFVADASGDYVVGGSHYSIVTEPDVADIATYYELTIDESLNNYVGTHLALDAEGLWLLPASSGTNKVLIATGAGSTYTTAGTYIIDSGGATMASFRADGATINGSNGTYIAHLGYGSGTSSGGGTATAPYYSIGARASGSTDTTASGYASHAENSGSSASGSYAHAEGYRTATSDGASHAEGNATRIVGVVNSASGTHAEGEGTTIYLAIGAHAEGYYSTVGASTDSASTRQNKQGAHAEGYFTTVSTGRGAHAEGTHTTASGNGAHAEGDHTTASSTFVSHAEGYYTEATGAYSHAQNNYTVAGYDSQTAIGKYNANQSSNAFEIGNGTGTTARSNAFAVDWSGNTVASGNITASGNATADNFLIDLSDYQTAGSVDKELYDAIVALGWDSDVLVN